jgi:hypothetical protein
MLFPYVSPNPRVSDVHDSGTTNHKRTVWLDLSQAVGRIAPLYCTVCDDLVGYALTDGLRFIPTAMDHLKGPHRPPTNP